MNSSNAIPENNNILPNFKKSSVFYPIIFVIIFLIIVLFCLLFKIPNPFNSNLNKSQQSIVADVFIILLFSLLIVTLCIILLPNFKEIKQLFLQISNVTYLIIYTIFLILFFTLLPPNILNNYAYLIIPFTLIFSIIFYYKSLNSNYVEKFNVNYERIKSMILFLCLIAIFIIYYNKDPGGYIKKYFGYSLLLTIIISVFAFLYLIIILTLPDKIIQPDLNSKFNNFFENFSFISSFGTISFLLFIIIVTIVISTYPGGFFNDKETSASVLIILLIISILWITTIGAVQFPEYTNNFVSNNKLNLLKRALLALFGIVISGLIIFWLVYNIQSLSNNSSILSLILNILLVIVVLSLIYKTINVKIPNGNSQKNAFFTLIINLIFYIPCLFSGLFDFTINEYKSTNLSSIIILILVIILLVLYFQVPQLINFFSLQGGKQLINQPIHLDLQSNLGTYQDLNGENNYDYRYAISFWLFLDGASPNTNISYNKYTSVLNFGNKPNILYNGSTNSLMITVEQKDLNKNTSNKLIDFDENGSRIIYKKDKILLQKWNNIIINYSGSVLDIFINGELVKSEEGVVPYYKIENLTTGEVNGIKGGVCNVVYFREPLNSWKIYNLYHLFKNKTPPVLIESNETVITNTANNVKK